MQNFIWRTLLFIGLAGPACAQTLGREIVIVEAPMGTMKIRLFEETPLHKANFLKLVRSGYYDSLLFHRVINQFMIQGGDPLSKRAAPGDSLGHGDLGYMVPAEFSRKLIHRKGRLCAARESDDINPQQSSSACQFYIVMGKVRNREDLKKYETRINKTFYKNCVMSFNKTISGEILNANLERYKKLNNQDSVTIINAMIENEINRLYLSKPLYAFDSCQVSTYLSTGGTPHLDGTYTVFGEVVEGLDVIDKIAALKTDGRDRPLQDIRMKMYVSRKKAKKSKILSGC